MLNSNKEEATRNKIQQEHDQEGFMTWQHQEQLKRLNSVPKLREVQVLQYFEEHSLKES